MLITECVNCGVDSDVHDMDGCTSPDMVKVRVCRTCQEVKAHCMCD